MPDVIEELHRGVLDLMSTVSSSSLRYRLREIHERLTEVMDTSVNNAVQEER